MTTTHWGLAEAHQEVVEAVRAVAEETEGPILTASRTVSLVLERAQSTLEVAGGRARGGWAMTSGNGSFQRQRSSSGKRKRRG